MDSITLKLMSENQNPEGTYTAIRASLIFLRKNAAASVAAGCMSITTMISPCNLSTAFLSSMFAIFLGNLMAFSGSLVDGIITANMLGTESMASFQLAMPLSLFTGVLIQPNCHIAPESFRLSGNLRTFYHAGQ